MLIGYDIEIVGKGPVKDLLNPWLDAGQLLSGAAYMTPRVLGTKDHTVVEYFWRWDRGEEMPTKIRQLLGRPNTLVGHNIKFDAVWTNVRTGTPIRCRFFDTAVAAALLSESERVDLGRVAEKYLGKKKLGEGSKVGEMSDDELRAYNLEDCRLALELVPVLEQQLEEEGLTKLFRWLMYLLENLYLMELRGVAVDRPALAELTDVSEDVKERALRALRTATGDDAFNPGSTQQMAKFLYEKLGLPVGGWTPKGNPSTDTASLSKVRVMAAEPEKEILDQVLQYRHTSKELSAFLLPMRDKLLAYDGRIHTRFNVGRTDLGGTVSGRLSSSSPNLQQIPSGGEVKTVFIPSPGRLFYEADYSQLELRVAGWLSGDQGFQRAFKEGRDLHTETASQLAGIPYEDFVKLLEDGDEKAKEWRRKAKTINFGVLYGAGPWTISEQLGLQGVQMSNTEAERLIENWRSHYPDYVAWEKAVQGFMRQHGWVMNELGRKRRFKPGERYSTRAERQAVNFLIQSMASDIGNLAIIQVEAKVGGVVLAVHDSILGEHNPGNFDPRQVSLAMVDEVCYTMKDDFGVPGLDDLVLEVEVETHKRAWKEAPIV